jgi:hypothetical protein
MQAVEVRNPPDSDSPATLRFAVTWRYLSDHSAKSRPQAHPPKSETPSALTIREAGIPPRPQPERPRVEWEMIIPKRERPGAASYSLARSPQRGATHRDAPVSTIPPKRAEPAKPDVIPEPAFCHPAESGTLKKLSRFGIPTLICLGVAAALSVGAMLLLSMRTSNQPAPVPVAPAVTTILGPALPMGAAEWIPEFAGPWSSGPHGRRRVLVMRASLPLTDFRADFQLRIENKAAGWVFRAKDARNFYVNKIEIVKPIPDPQIVLTRFAFIDGREQPRKQIPLPNQNWVDTLYRVRVEALGSRFTTWIQDQKIDEWTDVSIPAGGVGLYFERDEYGKLNGEMQVFPLIKR